MIRGGVAKAERAMGRGCGADGRHLMVPELSSGGPVSRFEFGFRVSRWSFLIHISISGNGRFRIWWWKIHKRPFPEMGMWMRNVKLRKFKGYIFLDRVTVVPREMSFRQRAGNHRKSMKFLRDC